MTAAIFGLVGVVIGALVAGGVNYWMERRRERADLRQARRLVADEIHTLWLQIDLILERGQLPPEAGEKERERFLSTSMWHAHKATLARALPEREWAALPTLYATTEDMRLVILRTPDLPLEAEGRAALTAMREQTATLHTLLTGHAP